MLRPAESNVLKGDGSFRGETQTASDYRRTTGDRFEKRIPVTSDVLKVCLKETFRIMNRCGSSTSSD
jgi:hypothetical protein